MSKPLTKQPKAPAKPPAKQPSRHEHRSTSQTNKQKQITQSEQMTERHKTRRERRHHKPAAPQSDKNFAPIAFSSRSLRWCTRLRCRRARLDRTRLSELNLSTSTARALILWSISLRRFCPRELFPKPFPGHRNKNESLKQPTAAKEKVSQAQHTAPKTESLQKFRTVGKPGALLTLNFTQKNAQGGPKKPTTPPQIAAM